MTTEKRSPQALISENELLRQRLEEAEDTLRAIGSGEVDAFVVSGPQGDQVYTLKGAEQPYRILVESMSEGAATLDRDGTILYCNGRLAELLQLPLEKLIGMRLGSFVDPAGLHLFSARLEHCSRDRASDEITLLTGAGDAVPVLISCCAYELSGGHGVSMLITDLRQKKRNDEIVASELLARAIIDQAGEAIIVCDPEGRIIRASRLAHDLSGRNPLLGSFDTVFPLRLTGRDVPFSVVAPLRGGLLKSVEVQFNRGDGQVFHLLLNASQMACLQSRIAGCVVTLTDITEQKRAEETIREGKSLLQASYRHLQEVNAELQAQGEELQTQGEELQSQSEELQAQNQELSRLWEESLRGTQALRESEQRFRAIFELSSIGKAQADPVSGRFTLVNDHFCEITGYSRKELLLKAFEEITHPEDRDRDSEVYRRAKNRDTSMWTTEKRYLRRDGSAVWVQVNGTVLFDPDGRPSSSIAAIIDITDRKRTQEALLRFNEELECRVVERTAELAATIEKLKAETTERLQAVDALREKEQMLVQQSRLAAMGEMINNIAHQWRQPLNALGLAVQQVEMLHEYDELTPGFVRTNTRHCMALIQHMSQTVDDFRDYFKPEKEKVRFNISKIISSTLAIVEGTFKHERVEIVVDSLNDPEVFGYKNDFAQSLLNILNNAKDALSERKIHQPKVCIAVFTERDRAVVTVTDNAGGIPEEIMPRIFEPYFTTKGPQSGTGIGLYMTKNIIETKMGGRLSVRNLNQGAEFRIEV
jgi:PAS domain S-box-containing protein